MRDNSTMQRIACKLNIHRWFSACKFSYAQPHVSALYKMFDDIVALDSDNHARTIECTVESIVGDRSRYHHYQYRCVHHQPDLFYWERTIIGEKHFWGMWERWEINLLPFASVSIPWERKTMQMLLQNRFALMVLCPAWLSPKLYQLLFAHFPLCCVEYCNFCKDVCTLERFWTSNKTMTECCEIITWR